MCGLFGSVWGQGDAVVKSSEVDQGREGGILMFNHTLYRPGKIHPLTAGGIPWYGMLMWHRRQRATH